MSRNQYETEEERIERLAKWGVRFTMLVVGVFCILMVLLFHRIQEGKK